MAGYPAGATSPGTLEIVKQAGEGGLDQLASRNDDRVDARPPVVLQVLPEHLSNQSFCPVSRHSPPELAGRDDAKSCFRTAVHEQQKGQVTPVLPEAAIEYVLKFTTAPDAVCPAEPLGLLWRCRSADHVRPGQEDETVRRLRPLARRRLSTSRPFFVLIRTRNPWVRLRLRRLGWNVRFMA